MSIQRLWTAAFVAAVLVPAATCQPDMQGGCKRSNDLMPDNFSGLTFYAVGSLTANGSPSSGVEQSKGGQVGVGRAMISRPVRRREAGCKLPMRFWTFLLQTNFLYNQSGLEHAAIQQTILANPQNVALLGAVSGTAKYYSWTLDPTFQVLLANTVRLYVFGGTGWLRRTINFTGTSSQGSLIQTSSPSVFGRGGNSAVVDGGFGFDFGRPRKKGEPRLSDIRGYWELRVLHGLAINQGSTLVPVSIGIRW